MEIIPFQLLIEGEELTRFSGSFHLRIITKFFDKENTSINLGDIKSYVGKIHKVIFS